MKLPLRTRHWLLLGLLWMGVGSLSPAHADTPQKYLDVQNFHPTPGPFDLIIVPQSQPLSHLSFSVGAYLNFALDPLVLLKGGEVIPDGHLVKNRLQLDLMGAIGLTKWFELGVSFPIILFQNSDDLNQIQRGGVIANTTRGDLSVLPKISLLHRWYPGKDRDIKLEPDPDKRPNKGLGVAIGLRTNLPTGDLANFASDGTVTFNPTVIVDYRFERGITISGQIGVYFRPTIMLTDRYDLGPTMTFALGAEFPIIRKYGITAMGGFYANLPLSGKIWDGGENRCVPAEALLGLRWYSDKGVVVSTGVNFGGDCGIGNPTFRYWLGVVWTPAVTKGALEKLSGEAEKIKQWKLDCPTLYQPGDSVREVCPLAYANKKLKQISTRGKVYFDVDKDSLMSESSELLDKVAEVIKAWLKENPNDVICADGHTDSSYRGTKQEGDEYNLMLSKNRANRVREYLEAKGIPGANLCARGFGRSKLRVPDVNPDGTVDPKAADANRRVEFPILSFSDGEPQKLVTDPNVVLPGAVLTPPTSEAPVPKAPASPSGTPAKPPRRSKPTRFAPETDGNLDAPRYEQTE